MAIHNLTIDMDKKCTRCGKIGVPCLSCAAKLIKEKGINMIGPKIIKGISEQIEAQMLTYQADINRGYLQTEEGAFPISLSVRLRAGAEPGKIESAVHISLVPRKVKDSSLKVLSEDPELEFDKTYELKK